MAGVDIYAAERERQQTCKTMICEFFDNITPHQKSVDLKAITQKYDSYREIDSEITRLSLQLAEEDSKLSSVLTFFDTTKQRHIATIATIQGQLATLNADKQIIDSVFRDYETNLRRNNNISYWLNKIVFFEVVRDNCDLAVQARTNYDDDVPTVVATSENPNTGGRKSRKRKSRKRKSRRIKSRKSRK